MTSNYETTPVYFIDETLNTAGIYIIHDVFVHGKYFVVENLKRTIFYQRYAFLRMIVVLPIFISRKSSPHYDIVSVKEAKLS